VVKSSSTKKVWKMKLLVYTSTWVWSSIMADNMIITIGTKYGRWIIVNHHH
jgi:hypothetical protein